MFKLFKPRNKKEMALLIMGIISALLIIASSIIFIIYPIRGTRLIVALVALIVFVLSLILFYSSWLMEIREKKKLAMTIAIINIVIAIILSGVSFVYYRGMSTFQNINDKTETITIYVVAPKDSSLNTAADIKGHTIGALPDSMLDQETTPYSLIEEDTKLTRDNYSVESYMNYIEIANAMLKDKIIDAMILDKVGLNQIISIDPEFTEQIKTLAKYEYKREISSGSSINISQTPFTVLISGIDARPYESGLFESQNSDVLILATFNPKTMKLLLSSTPRDSRVPISCQGGGLNKINSSGAGGVNCIVDTLSALYQTKIDYYVQINFSGVVQLIDAIGGIDVDVPYEIDVQNSVDSVVNGIHLMPGWQHLNGEQALGLARDRYSAPRGDLDRGAAQTLVIEAAIKKVASTGALLNFNELLNIASNNIKTNFSPDQLLDFFNLVNKIGQNSKFSESSQLLIERMSLDGATATIDGLSYVLPKEGSLISIQTEIRRVLETEDSPLPVAMSFNPNIPFEAKRAPVSTSERPISSSEDTYQPPVFPDFTGQTLSQVQSWCNTINGQMKNATITCSYVNTAGQSISDANATFVSATVRINSKLLNTQRITFTFNVQEKAPEKQKVTLPSFIGQTVAEAQSWCQANGIYCAFSTPSGQQVSDTSAIIQTADTNAGSSIEIGSTVRFVADVPIAKINVPSFVGSTLSNASSWCSQHNVVCQYVYEDGTSAAQADASSSIVAQSVTGDVNPGSSITFTIKNPEPKADSGE